MPLPQLNHPTFAVTVPSSKKKIRIRPYTVKEEKILLAAQASDDSSESVEAVKQVVSNCIVGDFNVNDAPTFDIEYIFIKLRAVSVNNVVELSYSDAQDLDEKGREKKHEFEVDLNNVEVRFLPEHTNKVDLGEGMGLIMRYPSFSTMERVKQYLNDTITQPSNQLAVDALFMIYAESIDTVYDDDKVYKASVDFTFEEVVEFVDKLNSKALVSIQKFFETIPTIYYNLEYKNSKGESKSLALTGLSDFFTL